MVFRLDFRSFAGVLFWHYQRHVVGVDGKIWIDPKSKNRSGGRLAARTRGELVHGGSSVASLPLRVLAASPPLGKE